MFTSGSNLAPGQRLRAVTGWSLGEACLSWASSHAEPSIKSVTILHGQGIYWLGGGRGVSRRDTLVLPECLSAGSVTRTRNQTGAVLFVPK